jgi:hypothetical protein
VAEVLEAEGYTTTLQDLDFRPGNSFLHQMSKAHKRAGHVIALLSPHYVAKEFTLNELYSALAKDGLGEARRLIPVRIAPCEIPDVINHIIYVDLVGKDKSAARDLLLDAVSPEGPRKPLVVTHRTAIAKLPTVDPTLLGRDPQLAFLDRAWADPAANLVQIIAAGGTGKTALVDKWFRRHLNEATIFGWSFYSQGTSENRQTSSDPFFAEILRFFQITVEPTASVYAKAEALADHLRKERVLLILDGCEPLQDAAGDMKDSALKALLQELATQNKGLVVCTTRVRINDVPDDPPRAQSIDLDNLDPEHGAEYLRHLGVEGVGRGTTRGLHSLRQPRPRTHAARHLPRGLLRQRRPPPHRDSEADGGRVEGRRTRPSRDGSLRPHVRRQTRTGDPARAGLLRPSGGAGGAQAGAARDAGSDVQGSAQATSRRAPDPDQGPIRPARLPPVDPRTLRGRDAGDRPRCLPRRPLAAI